MHGGSNIVFVEDPLKSFRSTLDVWNGNHDFLLGVLGLLGFALACRRLRHLLVNLFERPVWVSTTSEGRLDVVFFSRTVRLPIPHLRRANVSLMKPAESSRRKLTR